MSSQTRKSESQKSYKDERVKGRHPDNALTVGDGRFISGPETDQSQGKTGKE